MTNCADMSLSTMVKRGACGSGNNLLRSRTGFQRRIRLLEDFPADITTGAFDLSSCSVQRWESQNFIESECMDAGRKKHHIGSGGD